MRIGRDVGFGERVKIKKPPFYARAYLLAEARSGNMRSRTSRVMTRTYLKDHLEPIRETGAIVLRLIPPYPAGYVPEARARDTGGIADDADSSGDFALLYRDTWGQQAVLFEDERGPTVCFPPDLIANVHHVGSAYNLAYDVAPYTSPVTRHGVLAEAAQECIGCGAGS